MSALSVVCGHIVTSNQRSAAGKQRAEHRETDRAEETAEVTKKVGSGENVSNFLHASSGKLI